MNIERLYFKDVIEEYRRREAEQDPLDITHISLEESSPEDVAQKISALMQKRNEFLDKKRAAGRCLSAAQFKEFSELALEFAKDNAMDFRTEIHCGNGVLFLSGSFFDLNRDESPESFDAMLRLFSRADRIFIESSERYVEPVVNLLLYFALDK